MRRPRRALQPSQPSGPPMRVHPRGSGRRARLTKGEMSAKGTRRLLLGHLGVLSRKSVMRLTAAGGPMCRCVEGRRNEAREEGTTRR